MSDNEIIAALVESIRSLSAAIEAQSEPNPSHYTISMANKHEPPDLKDIYTSLFGPAVVTHKQAEVRMVELLRAERERAIYEEQLNKVAPFTTEKR